MSDAWDERSEFLRSLERVPGAAATAELLENAKPRWAGKVVPRTSMHDLLFTLPDDPFPWHREVRVSHLRGEFEFQLVRDGGLLVTADRASAEKAPAVLDAFLTQLDAR